MLWRRRKILVFRILKLLYFKDNRFYLTDFFYTLCFFLFLFSHAYILNSEINLSAREQISEFTFSIVSNFLRLRGKEIYKSFWGRV